MSNTAGEGGSNGTSAWAEFTWRGAPMLRRVQGLNERCLESLTQLARSQRPEAGVAFVRHNRPLWRRMTLAACNRASSLPFLLMDVHYQDAQWWRAAPSPSRRKIRADRPAVFAGRTGSGLIRETLMLSWNTVLLDRGAAGLLFGMTPAVSSVIADLGPQDIERIASRYSSHLRPRWDDFPAFWGKLLSAACAGDEDALHECRIHGVQLIGSELLPVPGRGPL